MSNALMPANPPFPSLSDQSAVWQWANYRSAAVLAELEREAAARGSGANVPVPLPQPLHLPFRSLIV